MDEAGFEDAIAFQRSTQFSRRGFAAISLVAGFTLATGPLNAATIITDAKGLDAGEVKVPVPDGEIPAYRAKPQGKTNLPVVIVVQEIFGVHEHIRDICRRFAKLGYYAIAPSLYARQGDVSQLQMEDIMKVVARVPDEQVMSDLDATAAYARATGKGDARRLGITGFCWGGRIVWLYAAHKPDLDAGVAWYGRLVAAPNAKPNPLTPKHTID